MIDCPDLGWGSLIGNACDHGLGYTKYGDHAQAICGMEVVLPDGEIIRTGMGALEQTETWNIYQNGYGPNPEQIFIQSNFGIITQAGFWVMPEPEYYLNGQISIAEDEDFPGFVDALRPLMVDGTIQNFPSCFGAPAILQLGGKRKDYWQGEGPIPLEIIETVRRKVGAGAWNLRFALYGREGQVDESFAHIRKTLDGVLGVTVTGQKYLTADLPQTELDQSASVQAGIPEMSMLESVKFWSDNGGHVGFSSVLPLAGKDVKATMELVQEACREFGLDYTSTFYIGSRFIVHVFLSFFDRDDDEQTRRVYRMCRETVQKAAALGYGEYRAHLSNMDVVSGVYSFNDDAQRRFNERLKDALDPKGILMPGRSGIWPVKYREQGTPDQPWL
jgi:4-cresol dehydrogenase (hydroxylating)